MLFAISGRVTQDVSRDAGALSWEFQSEIVRMLEGVRLSSPVTGIILLPTILNPEIASMPDNVTNRRDGGVWVALGLSHAEWVNAAALDRIDMFAKNISNSLMRVSEKRLVASD
jgi:hypothetical protein